MLITAVIITKKLKILNQNAPDLEELLNFRRDFIKDYSISFFPFFLFFSNFVEASVTQGGRI